MASPIKDDFSHPVYKKLAQINSEINKMSKEEIQKVLKDMHMDSRGTKDVIKKRLKSYYKKMKLAQNNIKTGQESAAFKYLLVIDFEATCEENAPDTYPHEIIEFPIVVVNCETMAVVDTYQRYVRPMLHRKLSPFCTQLTGITQAMVDQAAPFPEVLQDVEQWLSERNLIRRTANKEVAIVTDGPWDVLRFLQGQCRLSKLPFPRWAKDWINIRKLYAGYYGCRVVGGLHGLLASLGMTFEGRQHCGLDDAVNIARIVLRMMADGCCLRINEHLYNCQRRKHDAFVTMGNGSGDASERLPVYEEDIVAQETDIGRSVGSDLDDDEAVAGAAVTRDDNNDHAAEMSYCSSPNVLADLVKVSLRLGDLEVTGT